jgi:hypothetical protein
MLLLASIKCLIFLEVTGLAAVYGIPAAAGVYAIAMLLVFPIADLPTVSGIPAAAVFPSFAGVPAAVGDLIVF